MIFSVASCAAINAKACDSAVLRIRGSSSDNQTPTKKVRVSSARWMNCALRSDAGITERVCEAFVNLYIERINRTKLVFGVVGSP